MIVIDTSVLIGALTGPRTLLPELRREVAVGGRLRLPSLALFEWLRGPRQPTEIAAQEGLIPATSALPFGGEEAAVAAHLYRSVQRARGRDIDLAIAAHALVLGAEVWTANLSDFADVPGIMLHHP